MDWLREFIFFQEYLQMVSSSKLKKSSLKVFQRILL